MKYEDYKVGWICALPTEIAAAVCILDEKHEGLPTPPTDDNNYTLGHIGHHNVVIAGLPFGVMGVTSAARVAEQMRATFTSIRFALMVGIGGGAPSEENDIRLGDVVVSKPSNTSGGVIQYDFGKTVQEGRFVRIGSLNRPPDVLLNAVASLSARHMYEESRIPQILADSIARYPLRRQACTYLDANSDQLFHWEYDHVQQQATCVCCDRMRLETRSSRPSNHPKIHYGTLASGNQVMKDGKTRERIRRELNVMCFEMEAAGLMDSFPCLVIRGICDYADSHKNKQWQDYAAATAAAYAKELLCMMPGIQVLSTRAATETIKPHLKSSAPDSAKIRSQILQSLYQSDGGFTQQTDYEFHKSRNAIQVPGTCIWFLSHPKYQQWREEPSSSLLWLSAAAGCGKSVLASFLVDELRKSKSQGHVCHFFFNEGNKIQASALYALRALLHQILSARPTIPHLMSEEYVGKGDKMLNQFGDLWRNFEAVVTDGGAQDIFCVLDGLDECEMESKRLLLSETVSFLDRFRGVPSIRLKIIITSRPENCIETQLKRTPIISLRGEDEATATENDVKLVVKERLKELVVQSQLSQKHEELLYAKLIANADRSFLWVSLIMNLLKEALEDGASESELLSILEDRSIEELYKRILARCAKRPGAEAQARKLLQIIVAASRPLTATELDFALSIQSTHRSIDDLRPNLHSLPRNHIQQLCGHFIKFDKDGKIYLVHQTAREFLLHHQTVDNHSSNWYFIELAASHAVMADICQRYLLLKEFNAVPKSFGKHDWGAYEAQEQYCLQHPFLQYAATKWHHHVRFASDGNVLTPLMVASALTLSNTRSLRFWTWFFVYSPRWSRMMTVEMSALEYLGLGKIASPNQPRYEPPELGANVSPTASMEHTDFDEHSGRTEAFEPLSWAAAHGHFVVALIILKLGSNLCLKHQHQRKAALQEAIRSSSVNATCSHGAGLIASVLLQNFTRWDLSTRCRGYDPSVPDVIIDALRGNSIFELRVLMDLGITPRDSMRWAFAQATLALRVIQRGPGRRPPRWEGKVLDFVRDLQSYLTKIEAADRARAPRATDLFQVAEKKARRSGYKSWQMSKFEELYGDDSADEFCVPSAFEVQRSVKLDPKTPWEEMRLDWSWEVQEKGGANPGDYQLT